MRGIGHRRQLRTNADQRIDVEKPAIVGEFAGQLPAVQLEVLLAQHRVQPFRVALHRRHCFLQTAGSGPGQQRSRLRGMAAVSALIFRRGRRDSSQPFEFAEALRILWVQKLRP